MKPFVLIPAFALALFSSSNAQDDTNLLQTRRARLERIEPIMVPEKQVRAWVDGKPETSAEIQVPPDQSVDLVFGFGETVTPAQLAIHLPGKTRGARVEILASILSPDAGFRALRSVRCKASPKLQKFGFTPAAARWILLRITPLPGGRDVALAEIRVLGRRGPPKSRYTFKESPAAALKVLASLKTFDIRIHPDERSLFEDARDGKLDDWSFAEAALLVSGVRDAQRRKGYLRTLGRLEREARRALGDAKDPFARGERLLKWLHEKVFRSYQEGQTDVSTILDEGTYNCVSSATLYNVLARRMGLEVRAVEVPSHAFSILYDGSRHADVETTTPGGFNPSRDPEAQRAFSERTGFRYIPEEHPEKRREIGETGLLAIIYYNHGVRLTREKEYPEALAAYFRALSLDREFASAVQNVLFILADWSVALSEKGEFEKALEIVGLGLDLVPTDRTFIHNRRVIWTRWAQAAIDADEADRALEILRRAHKAVPDGGFLEMQAWVFISPAEKHIRKGEWEKALERVRAGLEKIDPGARGGLKEWEANLFLRWSNSKIEAGDYRSAAGILRRAIRAMPDEPRFRHNLGYVAQEWSWSVYTKGGFDEAEKVLSEMLELNPDSADVAESAENFVLRAAADLRDRGRYEEALAALDRGERWIRDRKLVERVKVSLFDAFARRHLESKEWEKALEIYARARRAFPGNALLKQNTLAAWDRWGRDRIKEKDWEGACRVYGEARKRFPREEYFQRGLGYVAHEWSLAVYRQDGPGAALKVLAALKERYPETPAILEAGRGFVLRWVNDLRKAEKYGEARAAIDRGKAWLKGKDEVRMLYRAVVRAEADGLVRRNEWEKATEVYRKALETDPENEALRLDAIATWDAWARTFISKKDWKGAVGIYERALEQFPDHDGLKNNLDYCRARLEE